MPQGFFSYFVQCCPKKIKITVKKIFLVQCCLQCCQGQHCLWKIVPKVLRQHCTGFFYAKLSAASWATLHKVMLPQKYYNNIEQDFLAQCCLEFLGQHCTRFLPVQCCPKSIKKTLNKIFPVHTRLLPVSK